MLAPDRNPTGWLTININYAITHNGRAGFSVGSFFNTKRPPTKQQTDFRDFHLFSMPLRVPLETSAERQA
jgi:hypothetical protein